MVSMSSISNWLSAFAGHVLDRLIGKELQEPPTGVGGNEENKEADVGSDAASVGAEHDSNVGSEDGDTEDDGDDGEDDDSDYSSINSYDSFDTTMKKAWHHDDSGELAKEYHLLFLRGVPLVGECEVHGSHYCCWHRRDLAK